LVAIFYFKIVLLNNNEAKMESESDKHLLRLIIPMLRIHRRDHNEGVRDSTEVSRWTPF